MNENVHVTFIGGSADLSRRVFPRRDLGRYIELPKVKPLSFDEYRFDVRYVEMSSERYVVIPAGRDHFIAMAEELTR